MVEYGIMVSVVVIVTIALVKILGMKVLSWFTAISDAF